MFTLEPLSGEKWPHSLEIFWGPLKHSCQPQIKKEFHNLRAVGTISHTRTKGARVLPYAGTCCISSQKDKNTWKKFLKPLWANCYHNTTLSF